MQMSKRKTAPAGSPRILLGMCSTPFQDNLADKTLRRTLAILTCQDLTVGRREEKAGVRDFADGEFRYAEGRRHESHSRWRDSRRAGSFPGGGCLLASNDNARGR